MPKRTSTITLGFLGTGSTPAESATALLTDLIDANGGKARIIIPITSAAWSDGIEAVADMALDKGFPLEIVTDDTTGSVKGAKQIVTQAQKTHKAVKTALKVVNLTSEADGKLVVFWDDEDDVYDALEAAENKGLEALDITDGLGKIELTEDEPEEAKVPEAPKAKGGDEYTDMDEGQLEEAADAAGIDVEAYEDWDDVREALRNAAKSEVPDDDDDDTFPTAKDIEGWDFSQLQKFAREQKIAVAPRTKTSGYKKAVLEFLTSTADHVAALEDEEDIPDDEVEIPDDDTDEVDVPDDEGPSTKVELDGPVIMRLGETLSNIQRSQAQIISMLGTMGVTIDRALKQGTFSPGFGEEPPSTGIKKTTKGLAKAATTPKAATAKAVAPKAATKAPAAAEEGLAFDPAAPAKTAGEEVMRSVLKLSGEDEVTMAQAKKILALWPDRPRGRPTRREQRLYAMAREVIPEEKRPVGRPRKA